MMQFSKNQFWNKVWDRDSYMIFYPVETTKYVSRTSQTMNFKIWESTSVNIIMKMTGFG